MVNIRPPMVARRRHHIDHRPRRQRSHIDSRQIDWHTVDSHARHQHAIRQRHDRTASHAARARGHAGGRCSRIDSITRHSDSLHSDSLRGSAGDGRLPRKHGGSPHGPTGMFVEQPRIRAGHRLQSEHGRNPGQSCGQPDAVVHRSFLMQGWEGCFGHLNAHAFAMGGRAN